MSVIERMWIREAERFSRYDDEEWDVIPYAKGYVVSNYGQVYSFVSHRLLNPTIVDGGRRIVGIKVEERKRTFDVGYLVALTFIGMPADDLEVNHVDGQPFNNHVSNLEWVTHAENMRHVKEVLRRPERWKEERSLKGIGNKRK